MTILNRQYGYLFIHVPKAAGKSIKDHLAQHTFNTTARTRLQLAQRLEALGSYAGGKPGLKTLIPALQGPGIDPRLRDYCKAKGLRTSAHLTAQQLLEALGSEYFRSLYSFAFVRNPWDRCLSAYYYFRRKAMHPLHETAMYLSFERFLEQQSELGMPFVGQQSWWLFGNDGEQLVQFIGKVERIAEDMARVHEALGLPTAAFASHTNVSTQRKRDYRGYYTDRALEILEQAMAQDIARLGYSFEAG